MCDVDHKITLNNQYLQYNKQNSLHISKLAYTCFIESKHTNPKENKMKTLTNRTNEKYTFLTIVFETREEAEKNANEDMGEFAGKLVKPLHGADGYAVKTADGFKEFIRLAV